MVDEGTRKTLSKIPLLKTKAGPRDKELWPQRLKEEYTALIQYVQNNKENDNDWFRLESNKDGTQWFGKCWHMHELLKYEFAIEFDIPVTYPTTVPEIAIPELDGKTAKMYRGGKICLTDHFKPLWARNVPKFGIAHAMALGVQLALQDASYTNKTLIDRFRFCLAEVQSRCGTALGLGETGSAICTVKLGPSLRPSRGMPQPHGEPGLIKYKRKAGQSVSLGPWLAVEIPDLIQKGIVVHKESTSETS